MSVPVAPAAGGGPHDDVLVQMHMPLARSIAGRYRNRGIELDDLEQVALLGLVKAARRFDPDAGHDFVSYAAPTVRGEIRRYFRDHGWMVRPPRRVQELQARIMGVRDELVAGLGRAPRPSEIAVRIGAGLADVEEALAADGCFTPYSLDIPAGDGSDSLGELLPSVDRDMVQADARLVIAPVMRVLSERERHIVRLRYRDEMTQREIAEVVGLTQAQVSRILHRALADLRALLLERSPAA